MEKFIIKNYKKVTMKTSFIETKYLGKIELPKDLINQLPQKIILASPVQFVPHLKEIKNKLSAYQKEVYFFKGLHTKYPGQILGCDNFKVKQEIDAFLYIGDVWNEMGNPFIAREYYKHAYTISKTIYEPGYFVIDMLKERLELALAKLEE